MNPRPPKSFDSTHAEVRNQRLFRMLSLLAKYVSAWRVRSPSGPVLQGYSSQNAVASACLDKALAKSGDETLPA